MSMHAFIYKTIITYTKPTLTNCPGQFLLCLKSRLRLLTCTVVTIMNGENNYQISPLSEGYISFFCRIQFYK